MGGKSSPAPPDYTAAAIASGEASRDVTEQQTWANRPDQYTPFGSVTWNNEQVYDPSTDQYLNRWMQSTQLDPKLQEALDSQINLQRDRSQLGEQLYGRMENEYLTPMDWGGLNDWGMLNGDVDARQQAAEDALYARSTSRLDPQWEQSEDKMIADMTAQGLRPTDPAWQQQIENFGRSKTDAYSQARNDAIVGGGQEASRLFGMDRDQAVFQTDTRNKQLAEAMQQRGFTLNEINALLTNQQVGMPQMPSFSQASSAQPVDYMGAAQNQYGASLDAYSADQAGLQGLMSGIGSIATAIPWSDRRLKKGITPIGKFGKFNLYAYTYVWGQKAIGVMADEVKKILPEAVIRHPSGYDMVDYTRISKEV